MVYIVLWYIYIWELLGGFQTLTVYCSGPVIMWVWPQNFAEKTFTDGSETAKNVNVFSLESFPQYGMLTAYKG